MILVPSSAFQWCYDAYKYFTKPSHGNVVPEFDGPAGIAAIALLVSVGCVVYNKMRE